MKRQLLALVGLASIALLATGCLVAPVQPPLGIVYSEWQAPLDFDYNQTQVPSKVGTAETTTILGLIATGDASATTAARNGGISTIHHADYEYYNVLGVIQRYSTVVYGE